jgi:hypothetical protein
MKQNLEIGRPLRLDVTWYDSVPEPARAVIYEGEVIGWRKSQVIVRVKDYAVMRFWKSDGNEVGNQDHLRRGFKIDTDELNHPQPGSGLDIAIDTDA